ncbi:MAG TPA: pantoate--beta-alanine ligase [Sulfuricurvum sp.]|nr:pantoate--beta-alanine ligase [Sulfuricurvum sp.]
MEILKTPAALKAALEIFKGSVGFVPTMGALHIGHKALIETARSANDAVVVSIFVNPTQFLEGEDLNAYPRRKEADEKICELAGVDYLFYPDVADMYGRDEVSLSAPDVRGYILEGTSRPGHFSGVLTVVNKLLNIVNPDRAYFGKKDAQQLMLIETMVSNLFMNVEIVPCETVRDDDGLALSSRNVYLSAQERSEALKIPRALKRATKLVMQGELETGRLQTEMLAVLEPLEVEYAVIVNRAFAPVEYVEIGNTIILVEAVVGTTRLLDNIWI